MLTYSHAFLLLLGVFNDTSWGSEYYSQGCTKDSPPQKTLKKTDRVSQYQTSGSNPDNMRGKANLSELAITEQGSSNMGNTLLAADNTSQIKGCCLCSIFSLQLSVRVFAAGLLLSLTLFHCVHACLLILCSSAELTVRHTHRVKQTHNDHINFTRSTISSTNKTPKQVLI